MTAQGQGGLAAAMNRTPGKGTEPQPSISQGAPALPGKVPHEPRLAPLGPFQMGETAPQGDQQMKHRGLKHLSPSSQPALPRRGEPGPGVRGQGGDAQTAAPRGQTLISWSPTAGRHRGAGVLLHFSPPGCSDPSPSAQPSPKTLSIAGTPFPDCQPAPPPEPGLGLPQKRAALPTHQPFVCSWTVCCGLCPPTPQGSGLRPHHALPSGEGWIPGQGQAHIPQGGTCTETPPPPSRRRPHSNLQGWSRLAREGAGR